MLKFGCFNICIFCTASSIRFFQQHQLANMAARPAATSSIICTTRCRIVQLEASPSLAKFVNFCLLQYSYDDLSSPSSQFPVAAHIHRHAATLFDPRHLTVSERGLQVWAV